MANKDNNTKRVAAGKSEERNVLKGGMRDARYLFSIMESEVIPLIIVKRAGAIVDITPAAAAIAGYSRDELVGQDIKLYLPQEDRESFIQSMREKLEESGMCHGETAVIRPDGKRKEVEFTAGLLYEDYYLGMLVDITEKKEVSRLRDEFIYVISHELRNPLATIRASIDLLNYSFRERTAHIEHLYVKGEIPEECYRGYFKDIDRLKTVLNSLEQISSLMDEMVQLTSIEMEKVVLKRKPFKMGEMLSSVVDSMQVVACHHSIVLELEEEAAGQVVEADPTRIQEVVTNLVSNAIRYSPAGGEIVLRAKKEVDQLLVSVEDEGIGIAEEEKERVFERFYMTSKAKDLDLDGLGLGLYISKKIMELHDGRIWLESEEGKGSKFYFTLPITQQPRKENG